MSRVPINTDKEFENTYLKSNLVKCDLNLKIKIPYSSAALRAMHFNTQSIKFEGCHFKEQVNISNCNPSRTAEGTVIRESVIEFIGCHFYDEIIAEDSILDCKIRFRDCHFHENVNFRNTSFKGLADFWKCTFYKPTTFYKTDFWDIVVFSAVTFKENVLFTYSLIDKLMILRGAFPEKGFDLSLAIISGELSIFDFQFDDYSSYGKIYNDTGKLLEKSNNTLSYIGAYETIYETAVSRQHLIPIENKRETYRILKNQLETQKNYIDSIPFKVMESKTLLKESWKKLVNGHTLTRPISNIIVLTLNAISNWFGSSYVMGVLFTFSIGTLFYYLSILNTNLYEFDWSINNEIFKRNLGAFVQYIIPTHRFDYASKYFNSDLRTNQYFYLWDVIGRVFVGYGIYQTIQAFRKYK